MALDLKRAAVAGSLGCCSLPAPCRQHLAKSMPSAADRLPGVSVHQRSTSFRITEDDQSCESQEEAPSLVPALINHAKDGDSFRAESLDDALGTLGNRMPAIDRNDSILL